MYGQLSADLRFVGTMPCESVLVQLFDLLNLLIPYLCPAGCTLPVEMFFPEAEFPTPAVEVALAALGVSCRRLHTASARLSGFTMKAATLLLSSFEEVGDLGEVRLNDVESWRSTTFEGLWFSNFHFVWGGRAFRAWEGHPRPCAALRV